MVNFHIQNQILGKRTFLQCPDFSSPVLALVLSNSEDAYKDNLYRRKQLKRKDYTWHSLSAFFLTINDSHESDGSQVYNGMPYGKLFFAFFSLK